MRRSTLYDQAEDPEGRLIWAYLYQLPTRIVYGIGISETVGEEAKALGAKRALIVSDPGVIAAGIVDQVVSHLKNTGITVDVYGEVVANPVIATIERGVELVKETQPDVIVGVGGGSSLDSAKLIAMMETNPGSVSDYFGYNLVKNRRRCSLIAIPTAAGTSSEVTMWAVVTDTENKRKQGIGSVLNNADLALVDPLLTMSMPPRQTAEVGLDALSHALEGYVSKGAWPVTDALAEAAIKLVSDNLRIAVADGKDIRARDNMMMASMMAGMAFPHAGAGMVHGMGQPLSAFYNFGHGYTMAAMMPYVEEFNRLANPAKFASLAKLLGESVDGLSDHRAAERAPVALAKIFEDVELPRLREMGASHEDIPALSEAAWEETGNLATNPRSMTKADIDHIYELAFS